MTGNVYLAAPLFSVWERDRNAVVGRGIMQAGYNALLPQSIEAPVGPDGLDMQFVFKECVRLLDKADVVVAIAEGPDVDSGTAWEMGYANARDIPTLCVRTDMRKAEQDVPVNTMLAYGSSETLCLTSYHGTSEAAIGRIVMKLEEMLDGNPV